MFAIFCVKFCARVVLLIAKLTKTKTRLLEMGTNELAAEM